MSTQGQGDVVEQIRERVFATVCPTHRFVDGEHIETQEGRISATDFGALLSEITRLRTLLSSSRGEQGWRTIDSAPATGEQILVFYPLRKYPICATAADGDWWRNELTGPTHWRPLPSAPGAAPTSVAGQVPDGRALKRGDRIIRNGQLLEFLESEVEGDKFIIIGAAPQPTAGGDAPTLEPLEWLNKALSRLEGVNEVDVPAAVAAAMTETYAFVYATRNALSAERARVIEECAKVAEREGEFRGDGDGEIWIANKIAAALRALGQQDTDK